MSRTGIVLVVAAIFVVAGIAAAKFSERPAPGGKEPQTSGQSIDPKSVGGPNDARQEPK
jgi:hypothetical protein